MKTTSWLVAIACLFLASLAFGGSGKPVNVVLLVEGTDADAVRHEVSEVLPPRIKIQEPDATRAALSTQGIMGNFADTLSNQRVRRQALGAIHKSLKQQGAPALIAIRSKRGRNGARELRVVLVTSEQVEPVVEEDVSLGKNEKPGNKVRALVAVPLEDIEPPTEAPVAAAPSKPAPAASPPPSPVADKSTKRATADVPKDPPAETKEPKERDKDESVVASANADTDRDTGPKKKRGRTDFTNALIEVEAAGEVGARRLEYTDALRGPLRSYLAPGVAGYAFGAQFYPGASSGVGFAKDIGVVGRYAGSLGIESQTRDGSQKASGTWTRTAVGLRGRIRAGAKADSPLVGLEVTYGSWAFEFQGEGAIVSEVPSVSYKYIRPAIDGRVPFGAVALFGGIGYMQILSAGQFSDRFPHASIAGVDAHAGVAYAFLPWLEARGEIDYTRVFSSAKPRSGDDYVAGGALDEYFIWHAGVAAAF